MCLHEYLYHLPCGHKLPNQGRTPTQHGSTFPDPAPAIAVPADLKCIPVKFAMKFYHDQVCYRSVEASLDVSKMKLPRRCSAVQPPTRPPTAAVRAAVGQEQLRWDQWMDQRMLEHGLGGPQRAGIQVEAAMVERDSLRREKRREDYPKNMYDHVQDVAEYQNRDAQAKAPNVFYTHVPWGCGRPGNAACLTGWTGVGLLMHRLHTWGGRDDPTNPDSYHIEIDYSNTAHLHGLGFQGELVRSLVQVPLPERLYQVLQSMHPGPLARYASGVGYPSRLLRPNEEVEAIGVGNPLWMFHPSVLEVGGATEAPSILQSDDVGAAASGGVWDPPAWRRRDAETERSQDEDLRARFRQRVQLVADEPNEPADRTTVANGNVPVAENVSGVSAGLRSRPTELDLTFSTH